MRFHLQMSSIQTMLLFLWFLFFASTVVLAAGDDIDEARFRVRRQIRYLQVRNVTVSTTSAFSSTTVPISSSNTVSFSSSSTSFSSLPSYTSSITSQTSTTPSNSVFRPIGTGITTDNDLSISKDTSSLTSDYGEPDKGHPTGTAPVKHSKPPNGSSKLFASSGSRIRGAPSGTAPGTKTRPSKESLSPLPSGGFPSIKFSYPTAPLGNKPGPTEILGPPVPFPPGPHEIFPTGCRPGTVRRNPNLITSTVRVTITQTVNATMTLPVGAETPPGVLIAPLPICAIERLIRPLARPGLALEPSVTTSTLLFTSKVTPVQFTPTAPGDLFPSSIEKLPAKSPIVLNPVIHDDQHPGSPPKNSNPPKNHPPPTQPETPPNKNPETPPDKNPETPPNKNPETPNKPPETPPNKNPETPNKNPKTPPNKNPETPNKPPETPPNRNPDTQPKTQPGSNGPSKPVSHPGTGSDNGPQKGSQEPETNNDNHGGSNPQQKPGSSKGPTNGSGPLPKPGSEKGTEPASGGGAPSGANRGTRPESGDGTHPSANGDNRSGPPGEGKLGSSDGAEHNSKEGTNSNGNGSPPARELNPSVVTVNHIPVSIGPAGVFIDSHKVPIGPLPTTLVVKGQNIAVGPSRILFAETTIPLVPKPNATPAKTVNIGNVPVILHPNNVVIGSQTFTPGASPVTIVHNGHTFQLDSSRSSSPKTTIGLPQAAAPKAGPPSLVTAGGQIFTLGPSGLQAPGLTVPLPLGPKTSSFVFKGQTFKLNPSQIIASDRFVAFPHATPPSQATFVLNDQTFSVDGSRFVAPSTTIPLSPGSKTIVYNGQTITIGPSQIIGPSITIHLVEAPGGPITAAPSAITAGGLTFSLGPSAAIFGSKTYSFSSGQAPTSIVFHGQTISIGPNGVGFAGTTIPIPTPPPSFSTVTAGGLTFAVGASEAVIGGHTFGVGPNIAPTYTVINGQKISIGPQGVGLASTTVPLLNPAAPSLSAITAGGLTFSLASNEAVFNGHTFKIGPGSSPITTVINGQTVSIGPQGIGLPSTTVPLPNPSFSTVTAGGLTFSLASNEAVLGGHTFTIGPGSSPITTVINGQTISIGPHGIGLATTTVALPSSQPSFSVVTEGDLTLSLSPSEAVISGKTFSVGPGSVPITTTINGQVVTIGPKGINFAGTTAALPSPTGEQSPSLVTADGLTFSVEPTDVIISGTTYPIGPGATPTTIVVGNETISLGPGGIGLPTTTILPPLPSATGTGNLSRAASVSSSLSKILIPTFLIAFSTIIIWM